jgi:adenylate cyclase
MELLRRGSLAQRIQLVTGLILFLFAATHFLNHALGLIDLETMHEVQQWRWRITRSWVGSTILTAALVVHIVSALVKLAGRATFKLPMWELVQIGLGLVIPFLLLPHIVNTRVAHVAYGVNDTYLYELAKLWPASAALQSLLLLVVWTHGCLGIHYWLRLDDGYKRVLPVLTVLAIAVPILALGGFMVAGRAVARLIEVQDSFDQVRALTKWPTDAASGALGVYRDYVRMASAAAVATVIAAVAWRQGARMTATKIKVNFTGGPVVSTPPGPTLLEISHMNGISHAAACGGRGRCSTCRVRIEDGLNTLPPPNFAEAFTLSSISAPRNVRLACQIRPTAPMIVTRLIQPNDAALDARQVDDGDSAGAEKPLAVLFLDMRGFTNMAEGRLPYDVVFILNEFFAATGDAITSHGGWIDKFMGDGLLAVFGQYNGIEAGCRQALRAARAIDLSLDHINAKLSAELGRSLRVGIGIHAGPILVGRIGYGERAGMTVIGNAVNVASRLDAMSKELDCQLVISANVAKQAGWLDVKGKTTQVSVRGLEAPLDIIGISRGRDLPASILGGVEEDETAA